ncbi:hypothetical protein EVAR_51329_1 [Eumeta japonica]|uniref:Uncharacterized protein n=1 Tax=Eumeta variegata TaxID=151549 RepID=A0A4C1XX07_EUMVA|nr:hypothetical protein EVAR_51329_1 [Eumeta japonica]
MHVETEKENLALVVRGYSVSRAIGSRVNKSTKGQQNYKIGLHHCFHRPQQPSTTLRKYLKSRGPAVSSYNISHYNGWAGVLRTPRTMKVLLPSPTTRQYTRTQYNTLILICDKMIAEL